MLWSDLTLWLRRRYYVLTHEQYCCVSCAGKYSHQHYQPRRLRLCLTHYNHQQHHNCQAHLWNVTMAPTKFALPTAALSVREFSKRALSTKETKLGCVLKRLYRISTQVKIESTPQTSSVQHLILISVSCSPTNFPAVFLKTFFILCISSTLARHFHLLTHDINPFNDNIYPSTNIMLIARAGVRFGVYTMPVVILVFYGKNMLSPSNILLGIVLTRTLVLSLTGCVSTSPGILNLFLVDISPPSLANNGPSKELHVRVGYFGMIILGCNTCALLTLNRSMHRGDR